MICSACNARNRPTARFCRSCGLEVKPVVAAEPPFAERSMPQPPMHRTGDQQRPAGSGPKWVDLTSIDFGSNVINKADEPQELIVDEYEEESIDDGRPEGSYIDFGSATSTRTEENETIDSAESEEAESHQFYSSDDEEYEDESNEEFSFQPDVTPPSKTETVTELSNLALFAPRQRMESSSPLSPAKMQEITQELPTIEYDGPETHTVAGNDRFSSGALANLVEFSSANRNVDPFVAETDDYLNTADSQSSVEKAQPESTMSFAPPTNVEERRNPIPKLVRDAAAHCHTCDLTFRRSDRFCTECGGKLTKPDMTSVQRMPACSRCRVQISHRHKFCPCCGNSVADATGVSATSEFFSTDVDSEDIPTFQA